MGKLLYVNSFGAGVPVAPTATLQAPNLDYVLVGRMYDKPNKALVIRVRTNGWIVWNKTYGGEHDAFFESIAQLEDKTFVAVGIYFHSIMSGDELLWIVRLDENGDVIEDKKLGDKKFKNDGCSVAATSDGGFIVTGLILNDEDEACSWVLKYDKDFNQVWERKLLKGVAHSVKQTKDGGYVLCGAQFIPGTLYSYAYVWRLDANGDTLWEKVYDEYEVYVLIDSDVIEDKDGNLIVAAKQVLMKLDKQGEKIWGNKNENLVLTCVTQMPDGNYAVGGAVIANNTDQAYVAVVDDSGSNVIWDNTELVQATYFSDMYVNSIGLLTGVAAINDKMYLATFDSTNSLF